MNKIFNKFLIVVLFVLGVVLIPNYKADAAITVTITANGSAGSKTVNSGDAIRIVWFSTGAISCTNNFGGTATTSGEYDYTASNSTGSPVATTYTINCIGIPDTPTGLTATPRICGSGMMDITWNAVPGVNEYILYDDSIGGYIYRGTATSLTPQSGLTLGSSHRYAVVSHDSDFYSPLSSTVEGTVTGACPPTGACEGTVAGSPNMPDGSPGLYEGMDCGDAFSTQAQCQQGWPAHGCRWNPAGIQ